MSGQWYVSKNGQQLGPYSLEHLSGEVHKGHVSGHDLVWKEGMSDWVRADGVSELAAVLSPPPLPPAGQVPGAHNLSPAPAAQGKKSRTLLLAGLVVALLFAFLLLGGGAIYYFFIAERDAPLRAGDLIGAWEIHDAGQTIGYIRFINNRRGIQVEEDWGDYDMFDYIVAEGDGYLAVTCTFEAGDIVEVEVIFDEPDNLRLIEDGREAGLRRIDNQEFERNIIRGQTEGN